MLPSLVTASAKHQIWLICNNCHLWHWCHFMSPVCNLLMQMDLTLNFLFPWLWMPFLVARINWLKKHWCKLQLDSPKVQNFQKWAKIIKLTFCLLKLKVCRYEISWSVLFEGEHPSSSLISNVILGLDQIQQYFLYSLKQKQRFKTLIDYSGLKIENSFRYKYHNYSYKRCGYLKFAFASQKIKCLSSFLWLNPDSVNPIR